MPRQKTRIAASACSYLVAVFLQVASCCAAVPAAEHAEAAQQAAEILDATGIKGGLVVHVGCGEGWLTEALRASDSYQVQGLDRDTANVRKAREYVKSRGTYGDVTIDRLAGRELPYIDNLINLLVIEEPTGIDESEAMRVLAPNGIAYTRQSDGWKKTVKPRPGDIDDWTHYLHDASGNAIAHDDTVGPPKHLQWLGSPRWSRHHDRMASLSAMVSAGGRIFYIMDEGSRISIQMPPQWKLIARDAFNGTVLWKQPIKTWRNHLWPLKSGPTQLARRLVTTGDQVYVTLGIDAPLSALDAATGEVIHEFADSAATEEVIEHDGVLIALVNKGKSELADYEPQFNVGDQRRVAQEFHWNEQPRQIKAYDAGTGDLLWSKETKVAPLTLTADPTNVLFSDGEKVVCVDKYTGEVTWNSPQAGHRQRMTMNFGPKLVLHKDVVLFAGGDRKMHAYSKRDGTELWDAPHAQSGYQSPEDLLVARGLVWNAPTTRTQDSGAFTGRDPQTGEIKVEFPPNVDTYWFHHRCYITKGTDNFLMPSRTGIEFVDVQAQEWNINHWVRGGCLYGVMPCNGMLYAPPHNCACYPEAKLYGLNALAADSPTRRALTSVSDELRLERGPAFGKFDSAESEPSPADWPTYRHDESRSGFTATKVPADLSQAWQVELKGKLSSVVVAQGRLFVAQVDEHTLHALDAEDGKQLWSYMTGGRIDSPPSVDKGRVLFGSADGWVYCLRASDGELAWRFRAAPRDLRLAAFEQVESVWPVHGSVLVKNDVAYFVAGRSNFLDGGLRFFRLDADTGEKLSESIIDDRDPETGANLQVRLQVLNMPVGLPDVLSSDGDSIYMRSQQFDLEGNRLGLGPHSGVPAQQGAVQAGDTAHLFAPMGFLDDTWFHRSYWVYGRSFAGGHAGYYQAGKYAPSGRMLVADESNIYGFGRKPQYLRWTTTMEHQLFSSSKQAPKEALGDSSAEAKRAARRGKTGSNMVRFKKAASINPAKTPLAVMAWVNAEQPDGVVAARGGPAVGYALILKGGRPNWIVRTSDEKVATVAGRRKIVGKWVHLAGVLTDDARLELYVDGRLVASGESGGLIPNDPAQSLEIGGDDGGAVGGYRSPHLFRGTIDEFRLYHGELTREEVAELGRPNAKPEGVEPKDATLQLFCSFDDGKAADESGHKNHGTLDGNKQTEGQFGAALQFQGIGGGRGSNSFVEHHWTQDVPLLVRSMVKAGDTLFIAGPPDLIDEEETFRKIMNRDQFVQQQLAEQNDALEGKLGGRLLAVSAKDGKTLAETQLDSLPTWDSLAAAGGKLYLSTTDGHVVCFEAGPQQVSAASE